ncbi:GDSL-type esterase/lipase family protein [Mucilaginibacter yixingensis]|nr:GDSL-type esterase/lipase family protein [Mucilaginibacter yixingensis]
MMRRLITAVALCAVFCGSASYAQQKGRYDGDVKTILAYDKMYQVPSHPIVFVGSSSIRKWDDLQEVFGSYKVINRGIGGAVIDDISYYADQLIFHYQPRQIVLYVGDNDVPRAEETVDTIVNKTVALYRQIRAKLPNVPLVYIGIKPSPSREKHREKIEAVNKALQQFFAGQPNTQFVDVYPLMLAKDGSFRRELFQPDMTHMVPQGYHIWEKALNRYLVKPE